MIPETKTSWTIGLETVLFTDKYEKIGNYPTIVASNMFHSLVGHRIHIRKRKKREIGKGLITRNS